MLSKFNIMMYLEMLFKKSINDITQNELEKVTDLPIEFMRKDNNEDQLSFDEVMGLFPNLKKLTLVNTIISQPFIDRLSLLNLDFLTFDRCSIRSDTSFQTLSSLKEIAIVNCSVLSYEFLKSINNGLSNLSIQNPMDETIVDISQLLYLKNLQSLTLEKCVVNNVDRLREISSLERISFLGSDINSIENNSVFSELPKLKELYISECYNDLDVPSSVSVYYNLNHLALETITK